MMEAAATTGGDQSETAATRPLHVGAATVSVPVAPQPEMELDDEREEYDEQSTAAVQPLSAPTAAAIRTSTTPANNADSLVAPSQIPSTSTLTSPSPSPSATSPPAKLTPAHFKPSVLLGEGSYSQVYLVHSQLDQQLYAMKVLNKAHLHRHNRTNVVYAEKAALTQCSHPNIVRLYHTFQDQSSLYFILELCDGGDVASLIEEREGEGGLPHQLVVYYAAQLLHCLHYLHHTAHIIHRDIKPDNMMLSTSGQLKLVDFGTAKLLDIPPHSSSKPTASSSPKKHSFVGTAAYVAPEILTSTEPHSYAVDQWSAGATIYQLITGRLPFQAASEYLTFQRILSGTAVEWLDGEGSEGGRELVERLLERDESKRLGVRADDWEEVKRMRLFDSVDWEHLDEWRVAAVRPSGGNGKKYSVMSEESLVGWRNSISSVRRVGGEEKDNTEQRVGKAAIVIEPPGTTNNSEERRGELIQDTILLPDSYLGSRLSVQHEGRESESKEERHDSHSHSLPATNPHSASVGYSSAPPSSFQSQLQLGETLTLCAAVRLATRPSPFLCCFPSSAAVSSSATHLLLTSSGRLLLINLTTGACLSQRLLSAVRSVQYEQRQGQGGGEMCSVLIIDGDKFQLLDGAKSADWLHAWQQARVEAHAVGAAMSGSYR